MPSICIVNAKGGVGKTVIAHTLARLSSRDRPTTVIDLDPQGSATSCFTDNVPEESNVRLLFEKNAKGESRLPELTPMKVEDNLFLLGSDVLLAVYEVEAGGPARYHKLKTYLSTHNDSWTIVDTQPSLGLLTMNALLACDYALIPVDASKFAVRSLADLFSTMHELNTDLRADDKLKIAGVVFSNVSPHFAYSRMVMADVRLAYGAWVMETVIPTSTRVKEATQERKIVTEGPAAPAFELFYRELQGRIT